MAANALVRPDYNPFSIQLTKVHDRLVPAPVSAMRQAGVRPQSSTRQVMTCGGYEGRART